MPWPQQAGVPGIGYQAMPQQPQVQPQQAPYISYSVDHLPPPPGLQLQQYVQPTGVPGMQQAQPYYGGLPATQPQQQPYVQPQWQQPPQQQVQPGYVPQAQLPPQAQSAVLNDNTILSGPAVPPELQGRSFGEVKRLYTALSTDWLQRNRPPQTPAAASLQAQGYAQPQGQPVPSQFQMPQQGAVPGQQPSWVTPIAQAVVQQLQPMLQPLQEQGQAQSIMQAREVARAGTADFSYLEPDVMQLVSGLSADALSKPQTWQMAINAARGARVAAGQYQPRAAPQMPTSQRQQFMPGPGAAVPAQPYQYFTESPTAPQLPGVGQPGPRQPSAEDQFHARKWGMTDDQWMQWKYGAQPQALPGGVY